MQKYSFCENKVFQYYTLFENRAESPAAELHLSLNHA